MDRALVLNQIISGVKNLREEGVKIFSRDIIVPNSEYMIEEYFEAKFNPYLEKITKQIRSFPGDEYIIVSIDTWIRSLQEEHSKINNSIIMDEFAEVLYIRQKYLPVFIDKLQDIKLEMLEREFNAHNLEVRSNNTNSALHGDIALKPDGLAVLVSLLYNHRIVKSSNSIDDLCVHFAALTGFSVDDIKNHLQFDSINARLKSNATIEELERIVKIVKVMGVRVETIIAERKRR